jgi:predicted nucleic acid-binding protein
MIVLDTNVVSEPLRPAPDQRVLDWINRQQPQTLFLTTVNVAELLAGIEKMPVGRRRSDLHHLLVGKVLPLFEGRILTFDRRAAEIFALVSTQAQVAGNQMDFADAAIAAIASAHGFDVATRNVRDFRDTGVAVIDPWAQ